MEVLPQREPGRIDLRFADAGELRAFVDSARSQGAFLLELAELPKPFATYRVALGLDGDLGVELKASVVQLFEAAEPPSAAFQIAETDAAWERNLDRRLRRAERPEEDRSERTGVPPIVRIRKMTVPQRMHLAAKADRVERAALLRDSSPQVLMRLLTNPRLGSDDVIQIIRNTQVSAGVLDRITRERRWLTNTEIQKALVRNPKTPSPMAIRLIDSLPTEELRKLAKIQSGLREPVRKAALRVYLKRSRR